MHCIQYDLVHLIVRVFDIGEVFVFLLGCVAAFKQYNMDHLCDSPSMMCFTILMAYSAYGVMDTLTRGSSEKEKPMKWVSGRGPRFISYKQPVKITVPDSYDETKNTMVPCLLPTNKLVWETVPTDCKAGDEFTVKVAFFGREGTTLIISIGMSLFLGVITILIYWWTSTFPATHCNDSLVTWGRAIVLSHTVSTCAFFATAMSVLLDDTFWPLRVNAQKVE
jgi:hypothetical protein